MPRERTRTATVATCLALLLAFAAMPASAGTGKTALRHSGAELLGLALLNCTRTGGWVRPDGSCKVRVKSPTATPPAALPLDQGISDMVAYRWAKALAKAKICDHVLPGKPVLAARFRSAGYTYPRFGENVGCGWGSVSAEQMVIATHRSMQSEKRTRGWHWRNMKNRDFKVVGIGVAQVGRVITIVYDFYGGQTQALGDESEAFG